MIYEFQEVGGTKRLEKFYRMADAPPLGTVIEENGRRYMRVASFSVNGYDASNSTKYPCEDVSLPRDTETPGGKGARGFPVFNSQTEHKEFGRRNGLGWD